MLEKFLPRIEFDSYEDFKQNYKVNVPEKFNFAYDVVDGWAEQDKNKPALLYCDDFGTRRMYTFEDLSLLSNKAANFLINNGKKEEEACVILDLPKADIKETAEFFCYRISSGNFENINFSFDGYAKTPRVILKGKPEDIFGIIDEYYKSSRN